MTLLRSLLLLGAAVSVWACDSDADLGGSGGSGGDVGQGGTGATGSNSGGSTSSGTAASGSGGATTSSGTGGVGPVDCTETSGQGWIFPTFDKSCQGAQDCMIAFHMISCCGTRAAIGLNVDEANDFGQAESECEAQAPGCGCAQGPTEVEDGQTTVDEASIVVDCIDLQCSTHLP